jgi:uncharacterized membrane protein
MAHRRLVLALLPVLIGSMSVLGQEDRTQSSIASEAARNIHRRERWFKQGRLAAAEPASIARYRGLRQKFALRTARRAQTRPNLPNGALSGEWVQLGPTPLKSDASGTGLQDYNDVAGRATAVAIDAADPTGNTVYMGGAFGGVWKSTNAGPLGTDPRSVAWVPLTDNQATLAVGSIAIQPQPSNPDPAKSVILVGTGETNGSSDSYYGLGILRSADAGNTWALIPNDSSTPPRPFAGLGFGKIAFSTNNPSLVVAATAASAEGVTEGEESPVLVNRGIYYSTDGGVSWNYATVKDGSTIIDAASVSAVVYNAGANQFFAAISLHGIYSSSDGINWSRLANQPGSLSAGSCPAHIASPSSCPIYRGEFAVVPNRPGPGGKGEMYVWYVDANEGDGGIWTSADGGTSWTQINDGGITSCGDLFGGCGTSQGFYDLALAAVPNGTATDLYAGAVNLYKCTVSVISPTCSGTGSGTFINLTHAYGCSSIARVHPAQHAIASMLVNNDNQDLMYFANDGGIYRALDGYTGLDNGSCGGSNMFDSLNGALGSITQLVSFSESSTTSPTPDILLAGAQGNGSPATVAAQNSTTWQNVNAGDGGYTAVSPVDDNLWFVSDPPDTVSGVNIFKCGSGINCHTQDFQNSEIVSGTTVSGDAGAFVTPFILDPQNPGEILVGTCRVWRGPSSGGSFTNLSDNFETGGTGICSGTETNLVRSLAAGGSLDSNGFSNVIYAGTDGSGPLSTTLPTGGRIWVSSNVAGGPSTWTDRTGSINPQNFSVSSIAVDSSDTLGLTAYVSMMGFHVSHVWKTIDAGVSWTDFTANLPDAPANTVLVDPGLTPDRSVVYVGTDVGVFVSGTVSADWTEVGPSPNSGSPGFLPNVAVTALHIFNPKGARRLRASTYGRGLWELSGFNLSRPVPAAVTVGTPDTSPPVTMQLTAAAFNGTVNLFCTVPAWAQCKFPGGGTTLSVNLSPANPFPFALTITTTAAAPSGAFPIAIHAAAPGYTTETQDLPVTVTGGFGFSIANLSGPQTVIAGQPATYNLNVAPSSVTFPNAVALSCAGLPALTACSFSPAQIPANSAATNVALTITTQAGTAPGTYSAITVNGVSGFVNANAQLTLTVQSSFSFSLSNFGPSTIATGSSGKYDITVTPSAGTFPNPVALSFSGCPLGTTCSFDMATIPAGSGTVDVFLTVATTAGASGTPPGPYSITVSGTSGSQTATTVVSFAVQSVAFSFSLSHSGPATVVAGASGKYDITITPSTGTFPNPVALGFTSCPPAATCSFDTALVPAGSGTTHVFLTLGTTAGTPPGPYSITVTGTSGSQTASTTISLTVQSNAFSFSMSNSGPATIVVGSSGKYDITVTPSAGTFPNPVALTFTGCPAVSTCTLDSARVAAGNGPTDVFLTIVTTPPAVGSQEQSRILLYALWMPMPGLVIVFGSVGGARSRWKLRTFLMSLTIALCAGCGGLSGGSTAPAKNPGTPVGTYTVTVIGTSGSLTANTTISLKVVTQ